MLALIVLLAVGHVARAGELQFSPSSCATDPRKTIYLALGRTVLRVPLDSLVYILNLTQDDPLDPPKVPDPDEPEGCPDRPVQAKVYTLRVKQSELLGQADSAKASEGKFVPFKLVWSSPDYWSLQPSAERRYNKRCSAFGVWEELQNGLVACRVRSADAPERDQTSAIAFQALLEVHKAPFDRPFIVDCSHLLLIGTQTCYNTYKLYPSVNFARKFDLQRVDVDDLVDVDRGLRAWIENARIIDYPWPQADTP